MLRCVAAALVCLAVLGPVPSARAQAEEDRYADAPPRLSESDVEEARSLFVAGSAAIEAGRWADAVDSFRRSYEVSGVPAALYNMAMALRALGRHREARDAFVILIDEHGPDLPVEMMRNGLVLRREEAERVATLVLEGLAAEPRHGITFDGSDVQDGGERPLAIETDAGTHSLVVRLDGHRAFLWDGALGDGERLALAVTLAPEVAPRRGVLRRPAFWIVTGVVLLAGAAVGLWLWDRSQQLDPQSDDHRVVMRP